MVRVRAVQSCFIGEVMRKPGDEFTIPDNSPKAPHIYEPLEGEGFTEAPKKRSRKSTTPPEVQPEQ